MYDNNQLSSSVSTLDHGNTGVATAEGAVILQSRELLGGRREIWIEHQGEMYRLRTTSRGKLYLTK